VTAATTQSAASNQSISTGRIFDARPFVNGIFASQISPGNGIVVETFVLWSVAIQERCVIARPWILSLLIHPRDKFGKVFRRQLLDSAFDLFDFAHS